jgi:putative hemolysin
MLSARTAVVPRPRPAATSARTLPRRLDARPLLPVQGRYEVRLARTRAELEAAQRLRFDVFNVELGEGLPRSILTGRDEDEFDASCEHLIVLDRDDGGTVGTYRLQTAAAARRGCGFYTASEFDLDALPADVQEGALELGRACIARAHRNTRVLYLLWRGIAELARRESKRWLFGCCSLTSQDPREGRALLDVLDARGALHPEIHVRPRAAFRCRPTLEPGLAAPAVAVPRLFDMYLAMGAKVCGEPALDRAFGTIDYLVLFDLEDLDATSRRRFLPASPRA